MKLPLLVFICCQTASLAYAADLTAIQNGNWNVSSTWDLGRPPADNDVVIIPLGIQVNFTGSPYPKNTPAVRPTLRIKIYGILDFSNSGNDKLYLDAGSTINIYSTGKIQTTSPSSEIIAIYNGGSDNTVWVGTPAVISGPAGATASSLGFANGILPVKLESFVLIKDGDGKANLEWITTDEVNNAYYEIETATSINSTWQYVGKKLASVSSGSRKIYSYTVTLSIGENRFRLKQVDVNGQYTLSPVIKTTYTNNGHLAIFYNKYLNRLVVNNLGHNNLDIAVYTMAGHLVLLERNVRSMFSFRPTSAGIYVVKVKSDRSQLIHKMFAY